MNWNNHVYVAVILGYIITRDTGIVMDKETIRCWIINAGVTLIISYAAYSGVILYKMLTRGLDWASAKVTHRIYAWRNRRVRQSCETAN